MASVGRDCHLERVGMMVEEGQAIAADTTPRPEECQPGPRDGAWRSRQAPSRVDPSVGLALSSTGYAFRGNR